MREQNYILKVSVALKGGDRVQNTPHYRSDASKVDLIDSHTYTFGQRPWQLIFRNCPFEIKIEHCTL